MEWPIVVIHILLRPGYHFIRSFDVTLHIQFEWGSNFTLRRRKKNTVNTKFSCFWSIIQTLHAHKRHTQICIYSEITILILKPSKWVLTGPTWKNLLNLKSVMHSLPPETSNIHAHTTPNKRISVLYSRNYTQHSTYTSEKEEKQIKYKLFSCKPALHSSDAMLCPLQNPTGIHSHLDNNKTFSAFFMLIVCIQNARVCVCVHKI